MNKDHISEQAVQRDITAQIRKLYGQLKIVLLFTWSSLKKVRNMTQTQRVPQGSAWNALVCSWTGYILLTK